MSSRSIVIISCLILFSGVVNAQTKFPYLDRNLPDETRVTDLIKRMTLEEKIAQMCQYVGIEHIKKTEKKYRDKNQLKNNDTYGVYPKLGIAGVEKMVESGLIGSFLHVVTATEANYLQSLAQKSRLKIPLIIGIDAIHGNGLVEGSTIYPSPIGLSSTWDTLLVKKTARYTAIEMRETGSQWAFSPNLDVARDARWGRIGETFGEDPFLVSMMGVSMIKGLQGENGLMRNGVLACAKHLVGGSQPVNGLNKAPTDISERTLQEIHLPPFKAAVNQGVYTIMPAHNEINGIPCHAHQYLMEELLRKKWNFEGFYISDFMDIERLVEIHGTAADQKQAVALTVKAGMDMHMHGPNFLEPLLELVKSGEISEERIDASVKRILLAKFKLGLFENPFVPEKSAILFNQTHQQAALEAAHKSIVLLKNDGILPLNALKGKKILVTGPNANNQSVLGDWSLKQPDDKVLTVYQGIAKEAELHGAATTYFDAGQSILEMQPDLIKQAGEKAKEADIIVVVVGDNSLRFEAKRTAGENVDRDNIGLPGLQQQLVEELHKSGKQVVVVLVNGRPLSIPWIDENVSAIVEAWEPGSFGGKAIADVVFGHVNPSGKLTVTFPQNAGQIASYYNHKPSQYINKYIDSKTGFLYSFGYGLSYTNYSYSDIKLSKTQVKDGESFEASIEVTNNGKLAGEEVVQLYINGSTSEVSKPVKELKGFYRVKLSPGEKKTVKFKVSPEMLYNYDKNMNYGLEPGDFKIMIGSSSRESDLKVQTLKVNK